MTSDGDAGDQSSSPVGLKWVMRQQVPLHAEPSSRRASPGDRLSSFLRGKISCSVHRLVVDSGTELRMFEFLILHLHPESCRQGKSLFARFYMVLGIDHMA